MTTDIENRPYSAPSVHLRRGTYPLEDKLRYVWARMASRYGDQWTRSHGAAPSVVDAGEWGEMLKPLSMDQIRAGFSTDLERGENFAPSSAMFSKLCAGSPQSRLAAYQPFTSLSRRIETDRGKALARREIAKIRKKLHVSE